LHDELGKLANLGPPRRTDQPNSALALLWCGRGLVRRLVGLTTLELPEVFGQSQTGVLGHFVEGREDPG